MKKRLALGFLFLTAPAAVSPALAQPDDPAIQIVERLRLLRELPPLLSNLRELEGRALWTLESKATVYINASNSRMLREDVSSAGSLRTKTKTLVEHSDEDCRSIGKSQYAENKELIADLAAQCMVFSAALTKNVDQLAAITELELRSPPGTAAWNPQPYFEAAPAYLEASRVLNAAGARLTVDLENLKIGRSSWAAGYDFTFIRVGAVGFWCSLLVLLFFKGLREKFESIFSLPKPASQAVIKPFDALRGLSALWVALFHIQSLFKQLNLYAPTSDFIGSGKMAVPVFVTMSAFLIFRTVEKADSWADLGDYFKRRWLRIYPLYFAVLVAILLCGHFPTVAQLGWRRLTAEFLMLRLVGSPHILNPPAWSLYVEEGFYLMIPAWFFLFRRRVSLGAALSYVAVSVLYFRHPSPKPICCGISASASC